MVLSGCGHAGIVNTVRYARRLTGQDKVAAIVGGFHLSGPMFEPIIGPTVDALAELSPSLLVPAHCTGWRACHQMAARFPDAFVMSTVGTHDHALSIPISIISAASCRPVTVRSGRARCVPSGSCPSLLRRHPSLPRPRALRGQR